jgi:RES domain-containing protein
MSQSIALAVLENLVHLSRENFPSGYVVVKAVVPDDLLVLSADRAEATQSRRRLGDRWLTSLSSAVLKVPSAVVPAEYNFLLNPAHPDFGRIHVESPQPFRFDERLFGSQR